MSFRGTSLPIIVMVSLTTTCSPSADNEVSDAVMTQSVPEIDSDSVPEVAPPLVSNMAPQPLPPKPEKIQQLRAPRFRKPTYEDPENRTLPEIKAIANYNVIDQRSPIVNGAFEGWTNLGPANWQGNFTYKLPQDTPEKDIDMYPSSLDGDWAMRILPRGSYLEIWQDVKIPEDVEAAPELEISAYVLNPQRPGFAIRLTYATQSEEFVAEVYPRAADETWTLYSARVQLPIDVVREAIRLYITRAPTIEEPIIVDAVSVRIANSVSS